MSLAVLLAGDAREVDRLATGDVATWQALFEYLLEKRPSEAPAAFVEATLRREESFETWCRTASMAAGVCNSPWFATVASATRPWLAWFFAGLAKIRAADDPVMLGARFARLIRDTSDDLLSQTRDLASDARRVWGTSVPFAHVLLLLSRRASEESAHEEGAAAREAESLFEAAGETQDAAFARRLRGAALLRLQRLEEAFEALDPVMVKRGPMFGGGGSFRFGGEKRDARSEVLEEAAAIAAWADGVTPEWVRALGGIAERFSNQKLGDASKGAELWARFERAFGAMLAASRDPDEDVEVVIRQASQRKLRKTVEVARRLASRAGT
jgi:hypothetical protein